MHYLFILIKSDYLTYSLHFSAYFFCLGEIISAYFKGKNTKNKIPYPEKKKLNLFGVKITKTIRS
jgi:hypothetical protein